ncbi:hypothetical protein PRZ61_12215 [Halomonas pacifica]|uniref:hypothetical protein n=1 Tax=Bisbaumannia pacifica TaxID=77098 RepID=UPI002358B590|nr:hypothetical protein [Halomonas pacifica]MDC8804206.1 hypothetical protein [Halomonas pacifica]
MSEPRFTVDDVMRAGGCAWGIRRWFNARGTNLPPGVTLRRFIAEGMSLDEARACRDGFINRALALKALAEEHGNGR